MQKQYKLYAIRMTCISMTIGMLRKLKIIENQHRKGTIDYKIKGLKTIEQVSLLKFTAMNYIFTHIKQSTKKL